MFELALPFVCNINVDDTKRKRYLGKTLIEPQTELFANEHVSECEFLKAILRGSYAHNVRLRRLVDVIFGAIELRNE